MRPTVTGGVARSVCRSVTIVSPAKTAELIDVSFGLWTRVDRRNHVLDGVHMAQPGEYKYAPPPTGAQPPIFGPYLLQPNGRSTCGSDAAFCRITLITLILPCRWPITCGACQLENKSNVDQACVDSDRPMFRVPYARSYVHTTYQ